MMVILHLVKTSTGGIWAFRLMRELVLLGDEVHVAMPVDGTLVPQYKEAGIVIHELNYSMKNAWGTIKQIRKVVDEVKPDVVHSHFVVTTLLMRLALRKRKVARVFEVPGPLHLEHALYRNADVWTAQKKKDFWIPTCQWSYDRYKASGIDKSRLFLTYYGGDLVDKTYEKGILRSELGLSDDDIIVGMVAFMYAPKKILGEKRGLKGHEDLIDAVALIQDKYPNLHLVMVGGPWAGAVEYEREVMAYGKQKVRNIHFLGTRNNVPELYQDFNYYHVGDVRNKISHADATAMTEGRLVVAESDEHSALIWMRDSIEFFIDRYEKAMVQVQGKKPNVVIITGDDVRIAAEHMKHEKH